MLLLALPLALAARPARADVLRVPLGQSVQAALAAAKPGDVVELEAGVHRERVVVPLRVTLRGEKGAVLDGGGEGTVVRVEGEGAIVEDLAVRNGGDDLGAPDCGVYVTKSARNAVVRRLNIRTQGFGVWMHENEGGQLLDSRIEGSTQGHRPDRGNGIQLFDCARILVRGNAVFDGRDGTFVEATDDSVIENNRFERTRYAVHYMWSHRNLVRGNYAAHSHGGIVLMYSREIEAVDNLAEHNSEAGLFVRDVQNSVVRDNRSRHNGMGLFFYSSTFNEVTGNLLSDNDVGMKLWGGSVSNRVSRNDFVGNGAPIFYVATQDLVLGDKQVGNYFSDYVGWDQDGDGVGDRPYRVDSFTTRLVHQYPIAVLLLRSPALELLLHLEQRMPVLRVPTVVDLQPLVRRGP